MRWFLQNKKGAYQEYREKTKLSPLLGLLLANRDIGVEEAEAFLQADKAPLFDPFLFREMDLACDYLLQCLQAHIPIRIVGDYDQDGVAATTILMKGLQYLADQFGADPDSLVSYAIPDRIEDGYGLNKRIVDQALDQEVGLILTCDNGIAALEALDYAYEMQMPVIVTDHHRPVLVDGKEVRPQCEALLNPHVTGETYPFQELCGAGVAWKLIQALFQKAGGDQELLEDLLAFAALGTICDVMPLVGENRILTIRGLKALNERKNPGLRALLQVTGWDKEINVYAAGFIIGPCINASGRLLTARLGVELFLEEEEETLAHYAQELYRLNEERKAMTKEGLDRALEALAKKPLDPILAEYVPGIHESVCGLVAGRIKDKYHRPCLIFTDAANRPGVLKGSGRSIPAYPMFDRLNPYRKDYLAFGGHAMACGMSLKKEDLPRLRKTWNANAGLSPEDFLAEMTCDARLDLRGIQQEVMTTVDRLEPYGVGNPKPIFASLATNVKSLRLVGKKKNVLQLFLEKDGATFPGVLFQAEEKIAELRKTGGPQLPALEELLQGRPAALSLDILYTPEWNSYRDQKKIQLKLRDLRLSRV